MTDDKIEVFNYTAIGQLERTPKNALFVREQDHNKTMKSAQKEIARLKEENESLRCCGNCDRALWKVPISQCNTCKKK